MSRYAHNIYQVHIADGFVSDCDELIHKCLQYETLNFHMFTEIWKDSNFGMVYHGRSSGAEVAELSEELIHIAKQYFVKDTNNFEEVVAGLFLVYSLLKLQPFRGFAWLRIVPDDVAAINRIQVVARRDRRLDILYILGEVLVKHSQFHAAERDYGMESVLRKYLEGYTSIDKLGVRPRGVFYRQNEELDILRDLGAITRQYTRAKNSLISQPDSNLKYIDENLPNTLNKSLKLLINGIFDDDDIDDDNPITSKQDHSETVQAIKSKAMMNTVDPIKHLTGVEERKPTTSKITSPTKNELKSTLGTIKSYSPKKPPTNSPRKRRQSPVNPIKKRRHSHSQMDTELNLEDFHKVKCDKNEQINEENEIEVSIEESIDVQFDKSPVTIQTDGGKFIEIEIIDNSVNTNVDSSSKTRAYGKIDPKDLPLRKPRTRIKSKFKKLGMLPVANFADQPNKTNK